MKLPGVPPPQGWGQQSRPSTPARDMRMQRRGTWAALQEVGPGRTIPGGGAAEPAELLRLSLEWSGCLTAARAGPLPSCTATSPLPWPQCNPCSCPPAMCPARSSLVPPQTPRALGSSPFWKKMVMMNVPSRWTAGSMKSESCHHFLSFSKTLPL